jgi:hypothetical protein
VTREFFAVTPGFERVLSDFDWLAALSALKGFESRPTVHKHIIPKTYFNYCSTK